MSSRFRRAADGAITVSFEPVEAAVLASQVGQLVLMLEDEDAGEPGSSDPLATALGPGFGDLSGTVEAPTDDVLARLLPDGYRDDPEAAAEFRRFTEHDLRARKVSAASSVLETINEGAKVGGRLTLDVKQAHQWLAVLNDLRLALGTRLEVTEDIREVAAELADDDPRRALFEMYDWLTWLQDGLVEVLAEEL
jgi:Domain of unknown function (DUF2017)